ncbi:hypothetical protein [Streptomyces sp. NPDC058268]|uniref:hypothetical protein n=1 Tax=Streptomyces sp. NPDC058268 TaxID=3346413 RepID=UPI0036E8C835
MNSPFEPLPPGADELIGGEPAPELECTCVPPDDQYVLEIESGSVFLVHAACEKPAQPWTDDSYSLCPTPVTLTWHSSRDYWTGEVDAVGELTINNLPCITETHAVGPGLRSAVTGSGGEPV